MSAKFTPGPWSKMAISAALRAAHKHDGSWIDELGDGENMPDKYDASLIAAAPDMYEVIEEIAGMKITDCDAHDDANYMRDAARALLAKMRCEE